MILKGHKKKKPVKLALLFVDATPVDHEVIPTEIIKGEGLG